jgi:hypothetical protein
MVLFQSNTNDEPVQLVITETKKTRKPRKVKGGASAEQKGKAAELRSYINENIKGKMNECLFRDLSYIVHSGDRLPNAHGTNVFADPENKYDEDVEKILTFGIQNLNQVKAMDKKGLFLPKTSRCKDPDGATTTHITHGELAEKMSGKGYGTELYGGTGEFYELLKGGSMNTKLIRKFLDASYANKGKAPKEIDGYNRDESLSGERVSVYYNPTTHDAVVIHRGSKGIHDWGNNLKMALGWKMSGTKRFQHAKDIQKKAEAKYGKEHTTTLGHSLGAKIASDVGEDSKEIINLNKATGIGWDKYKNKHGEKANETNIRTTLDPVSAKGVLDADLTIPSKSLNLIKEHGTGVLDRVDVEVGKGYEMPTFNRRDYEKLTKKQLKTIIKSLPKKYDNFRLTGAGKPQLVDYIQNRCCCDGK